MKTIRQAVLEALNNNIEKYFLLLSVTQETEIVRQRWKIFPILKANRFNQKEIADHFGISQGAVSHGLRMQKEIEEFEKERRLIHKF